MSSPSTISSLESYVDSDDDETPRPNRSNPFMAYRPQPPRTDPPRAYDAPTNYDDDDFEEEDRRWDAARSLLRHLHPAADGEEGSEDHDSSYSSSYLHRHEWWGFGDINTLDDLTACIGIWLLAFLVAIVIVGAAAAVWILVTQ